METHHSHHPDSYRDHKKKWTEYLLKFFMLFLAVFLGFNAENIRGSVVEHHREKEYMISILSDLKKDTQSMNKATSLFTRIAYREDTMLRCIKEDTHDIGKLYHPISGSFWNFTGLVITTKRSSK